MKIAIPRLNAIDWGEKKKNEGYSNSFIYTAEYHGWRLELWAYELNGDLNGVSVTFTPPFKFAKVMRTSDPLMVERWLKDVETKNHITEYEG